MKKFSIVLIVLFALFAFGCCNAQAQTQTMTVTLSWTNVGDDVNDGIAAELDARYSPDSMLLINSWNSTAWVENWPAPDSAGVNQSYTFSIPLEDLYMALWTVDDAGNRSEISNIVHLAPVFVDSLPPAVILDLSVESIIVTND